MEGFEEERVREVLKLAAELHAWWRCWRLAMRAAPDKFSGGRFSMARTVFGEEYGKPIKF